MTTITETELGVSIREAADALGVSPNAVRMRIRHKTIAAFKPGEQWRVILNGESAEAGRSPTSHHLSRPTSPPTSVETDLPPVALAAQAQLALVIREAVAPFVEELGRVQHRLGATEQELAQERERRQQIEHKYDVASKELAGLRMALHATGHKREEAVRAQVPVTVATAHEEESPANDTNVAPGGAGEAERASAQRTEKQRWPWWMRILGGR